MPYIVQVMAGKWDVLKIFVDDYPAKDGTGIRYYIHVMGLSEGHLAAMECLASHTGLHIFNLGTGIGYSVLNMVRAYEVVSEKLQ